MGLQLQLLKHPGNVLPSREMIHINGLGYEWADSSFKSRKPEALRQFKRTVQGCYQAPANPGAARASAQTGTALHPISTASALELSSRGVWERSVWMELWREMGSWGKSERMQEDWVAGLGRRVA